MTLPMTGAGLSAGAGALSYLLNAPFTADDQGYSNTQVLDTVAEGIAAGSLTVAEVGATLALVSNECTFQGGGSWTGCVLTSQAIDRAFGLALIATFKKNVLATYGPALLWNDDATFPADFSEVEGFALIFWDDVNLVLYNRAAVNSSVATYATATDYQLALVLGGYDASGNPWYSGETTTDYLYGVVAFIKGGAYSDWTRLMQSALHNDDPVYAVFTDYSAAGTVDDMRVPDASLSTLFLPANLSTFDAANGTSLDAITPEVGNSWVEGLGNWDIQSNRANPVSLSGNVARATVDTGLSNCVLECVTSITGGSASGGLLVRYTDANNHWFVILSAGLNYVQLWDVQGGSALQRGSAAVTVNVGTDYKIQVVLRGDYLVVFVDDTIKLGFASSFNNAATKHGIWSQIAAAEQNFNNFLVFPRTDASYDAALDAV